MLKLKHVLSNRAPSTVAVQWNIFINIKCVFRYFLKQQDSCLAASSEHLGSIRDAKGCKANLTNGQSDIYVPIAPV